MLASTHFNIRRLREDDWFDPILDADTELFVDPFLAFKDKSEFWKLGHRRIIDHFDQAFLLIANGNRNPNSIQYRKALALLVFREPKELCLGYTSKGTAGLGSGLGYAAAIAEAISDAIQRGLQHPKHFEELGILNEGIGPDRMSDITCTILKSWLVQYTQKIAERHSIPTKGRHIFAAAFDRDRMRWEIPEVEVPTNPYNGGPLLFVPERFLRDLPVLNVDDWWNYYETELLREDLNYEILGKVNKEGDCRSRPAEPRFGPCWDSQERKRSASGYDFPNDPNGVWQWGIKRVSRSLPKIHSSCHRRDKAGFSGYHHNKCDIFLTRDFRTILKKRPEIEREFTIKLKRPSELFAEIQRGRW